MSVLKSELKMLVTHEVGVRVDDSLEVAKKDLAMLEGRQTGFADGAKAVETLLTHVDKDVTEEKLDVDTATKVKLYVTRAVHALNNLAQQVSNQRIAQTGKVQGLEQTVALLKNMVDAERAKTEALQTAEATAAPTNPRERAEGARPAASIKELRLAEEVAEKKAAPSKGRGGRKPRANHA